MNQPYEGATPEQLSSPLVREFLAVHDMFRSELAAMLRFVNQLMQGEVQLQSPETQSRVQTLIRVGSRYTQMLHLHHNIESSSMFPRLRVEGLAGEVVEKLERDHDEISVLIDQFSDAIHDFSAIEPDVINNDLRRLSDALHAHLAYEETHVCPLLARFNHWPLH
jgi:hemerythrin-like domain-containing protein